MLRAIQQRWSAESFLYCADGSHFPYGVLDEALIRERVLELTRFLVAQGAKMIVVACNTATAAAVHEVRERTALPVVAMEPAVKPAALATRTGRIAVLATPHTLASARLAALLQTHARDVTWYTDPCTGWVEQVERGELSGPATQALVAKTVTPLVERGVDTLVLGCTHFPFLRETIAAAAGPNVAILDSGEAVTRQVGRLLEGYGLLAPEGGSASVRFWTTGDPERLAAVLRRLGWQEAVSTCPQTRPLAV